MPDKRLLAGIIIISVMQVIGTIIFINSSFNQVERSQVVLDNSFRVPANNYQISEPVSFPNGSEILYSFTVSKGTIKFFDLDTYFYKYWQEDRDKLLPMLSRGWIEGDIVNHRVYGEDEIRCVFLNEDSYDKEVNVKITVTWPETNYLGMMSGIAVVAIGPVLGMGVKTKKLL